jgi:hypothetical protein
VHLQRGLPAHERARGARVIEMDVTEQQVAHVRERDPVLGETGLERGDRRRRTSVEERRAFVRVEEVGRDGSLAALVVKVDRLEHGAILCVEIEERHRPDEDGLGRDSFERLERACAVRVREDDLRLERSGDPEQLAQLEKRLDRDDVGEHAARLDSDRPHQRVEGLELGRLGRRGAADDDVEPLGRHGDEAGAADDRLEPVCE